VGVGLGGSETFINRLETPPPVRSLPNAIARVWDGVDWNRIIRKKEVGEGRGGLTARPRA